MVDNVVKKAPPAAAPVVSGAGLTGLGSEKPSGSTNKDLLDQMSKDLRAAQAAAAG